MFEVGKRVIAIIDHNHGLFKKGDVFELIGIKKSPCKCNEIDLNIGIINKYKGQHCSKCGSFWIKNDDYSWYSSTRFAPYDDSLSEHTADSLIEELETELTPAI